MQYYIIIATKILIAGVIFPEPFRKISPIFLVTNYLKKISVILRHRLNNTTKEKQTT